MNLDEFIEEIYKPDQQKLKEMHCALVGDLTGKPGLVDRVSKIEKTHGRIIKAGWIVVVAFVAQIFFWLRTKFWG